MKIYLALNALLYAVFALWCTISPWKTSTNIGYTTLGSGGRSEYLVVYGGLQLGLALIFGLLARGDANLTRFGILASVCLYAPIVAYRIVTVARFWPVPSTTLAVGSLEVVLLAAAVILGLRSAA